MSTNAQTRWIAYGDCVYGPFENYTAAYKYAHTHGWQDWDTARTEADAWALIAAN